MRNAFKVKWIENIYLADIVAIFFARASELVTLTLKPRFDAESCSMPVFQNYVIVYLWGTSTAATQTGHTLRHAR